MMKCYIRKINYHETDKMAVVHHSNYVKFMEEARVDFLEQIGVSYPEFEAQGVVSPVVSVSVEYKTPARFGDTLFIQVTQTEYTGPRVGYAYEMRNQEGKLVCRAASQHCFTVDGRIRPLSHGYEHYDEILKNAINK